MSGLTTKRGGPPRLYGGLSSHGQSFARPESSIGVGLVVPHNLTIADRVVPTLISVYTKCAGVIDACLHGLELLLIVQESSTTLATLASTLPSASAPASASAAATASASAAASAFLLLGVIHRTPFAFNRQELLFLSWRPK